VFMLLKIFLQRL